MPGNGEGNTIMFKPFSIESPGAIYRLLLESYSDLIRDNPAWCAEWQRNWKKYDEDIFAQPHTIGECGFITRVDGTVIGFASYDPRGQAGSALVGHNCILPAFRGKGFGTLQLRELLRVLRRRGFLKAVATTCDHVFFMPARRMYAACGFKETGRSGTAPASGFRTINLECDLTVRIRPATENDFGGVLSLFGQLWPEKVLNRESQQAIYNAMLESEGYELFCAEKEGAIAGFASLSIQHNFWQEGYILYIATMIVDEKHRRQGIGTALIREIEKIARERDCKRIELESAFHRKEAHAFYEKMGFEKRAYFYSREVK